MSKQMDYLNRDFESLKGGLREYIVNKYPDFSANVADENSIVSLLLDLNAVVADTMNFYIDKNFNEQFITTAQEKESLYRLAHSLGYSPKGKQPARGSVTLEIKIPYQIWNNGQAATQDNLPRLDIYQSYFSLTDSTGTESRYRFLYPVDFNNKVKAFFDAGAVGSKFVNGITWSWADSGDYIIVYAKVPVEGSYFANITLGPFKGKPFEKVTLTDTDFYKVHQVYTKSSAIANVRYTGFAFDELWFEVDYMVNPYGFTTVDPITGSSKRLQTRRRFIKRNTPTGSSFIFGYQAMDTLGMKDLLDEFAASKATPSLTDAHWPLGKRPDAGTELVCVYLQTTGSKSNQKENKLKTSNLTLTYELTPNDNSWIPKVSTSSLLDGGRDEESLEEIRHSVHSIFRNQARAVTAEDYINLLERVPEEWGVPVFKAGAAVRDVVIFKDPSSVTPTGSSITHKEIDLYALKLGSDGTLQYITDAQEQQSLTNYIDHFRMLTDTVYFRKPHIINIDIEYVATLYNNVISSRVQGEVDQAIRDFFDLRYWFFGQPVYYDDLAKLFSSIHGVKGIAALNIYETGDATKTNLFSKRSDIAGSTIIYPNQIYQLNNIAGTVR
jgi:hypothetical protein